MVFHESEADTLVLQIKSIVSTKRLHNLHNAVIRSKEAVRSLHTYVKEEEEKREGVIGRGKRRGVEEEVKSDLKAHVNQRDCVVKHMYGTIYVVIYIEPVIR